MSQSLLSLERVTKRFNGTPAVDNVSFTVDRGQVVGFLGPNGAGKSTTMRMITQFFEPDAGTITFDGTPLADAPREARRRLGFLPENNPLYTEMLTAEYLEFVARIRGVGGGSTGRKAAIDEAASATGLAEVFYRPIGELSKGFRQRVGLAAAILHRPDLLVLDEPTEGLDPNQRVDIRRLIGDLGRDRTVILSTHVLPEVQHTCSRVIIINRGRIAADGSVQDLIDRASQGTRVHVEARGSHVEARLGGVAGVAGVERHSSIDGRTRVTLTVKGDRDVRADVFELAKREGWTLLELHQERGTLEDLFRQLTMDAPDASSISSANKAMTS